MLWPLLKKQVRKIYYIIFFLLLGYLLRAQKTIDTSETNIQGKHYKSVNHRVNGKLIKSYTYDTKGKLAAEFNFVNDKYEGVSTVYYTDSISSSAVYEKLNYIGNLREGPVTCYFRNGDIYCQGFYGKNLREGTWTYYYMKTKEIYHIQHYESDKRNGESIYFYRNGKIKSTLINKDNKREGEFVEYYDNGSIQSKCKFKGDHIAGESLYYDKEGKLFNGDFTGYGIEAADSVPYLLKTVKCINGKPEGEMRFFRSKGSISLIIDFKNGKPEGKIIHYDKKGKATLIEYYEKGKFIKEEKSIEEKNEAD